MTEKKLKPPKIAKAAKAASRAEYTSPAVYKAIDVIEFLAVQSESVSTTAIAEGLNRTVGEIYRVVLALEQRRIVLRDQTSDRLSLSLRLFELVHSFPPLERLIQVARAEMATLALRSFQSCHLAIAEVHEITVVAAHESPLPMRYSVRRGSRFEIFETSSGVVIAAYSTELQREHMLDGIKPAHRGELEMRFESVRTKGYEMRTSETVSGMTNISVPVHSQNGEILAALTVPYLEQKGAPLAPAEVLVLLVETSARMRKALS